MSTSAELAGQPGSGPPPSGPGAIHDIGYRHYDGPRLGRGYLRTSLFAESLRGSYGFGRSARSKIMPILLLAGICFPALIISIVTSAFGADRLPITYTSYPFRVQVIIAIFVAAQAPAIMSRDLRYRVISLYFSRPLDRGDYVLAKYAAMVSALFILIALPVTILFLGALLAKLPVRDQVPDYLRAMVVALLLALVIAGIGLLVAAMTPRRGLGVAAVISVLLILSGIQLAVSEIATEFNNLRLAGYSGLLSPFSLVDGVVTKLFGAETSLPAAPPGTWGTVGFTAAYLLLVVGCYAALLIRYRRVAGA
ncbi:MAG TPA: ABC transporter permease subunit [Propionibacteriaceae bacterium]|nr:ABC transporter permease subunit [Propionibacteriaceae bacterium]